MPLMKCGHSSNGKDAKTGAPVCVICVCDEEMKEPNLSGRYAKCLYGCKELKPSNMKLAFFEWRPNSPYDSYCCQNHNWD